MPPVAPAVGSNDAMAPIRQYRPYVADVTSPRSSDPSGAAVAFDPFGIVQGDATVRNIIRTDHRFTPSSLERMVSRPHSMALQFQRFDVTFMPGAVDGVEDQHGTPDRPKPE